MDLIVVEGESERRSKVEEGAIVNRGLVPEVNKQIINRNIEREGERLEPLLVE